MHISQTNSYCSGEDAAPQNPSSKRNPKSAEEKFLAAPRSRNNPMGWEWKGQGESASAASVRGPSDWRSVIRKHREALSISADPLETKRILLKTIFFVNACLRWIEKILPFRRARFWSRKKEKCKNPLAPGKSCDRLAPVCVPHFLLLEFWGGAFVGKALEIHSGGLAQWASFF
jgi:hypothetical protein